MFRVRPACRQKLVCLGLETARRQKLACLGTYQLLPLRQHRVSQASGGVCLLPQPAQPAWLRGPGSVSVPRAALSLRGSLGSPAHGACSAEQQAGAAVSVPPGPPPGAPAHGSRSQRLAVPTGALMAWSPPAPLGTRVCVVPAPVSHTASHRPGPWVRISWDVSRTPWGRCTCVTRHRCLRR